jgi:hypothetical protein
MSPSHPDLDDPDGDWEPEPKPRWEPDPPWEPEPEPTPWSEREEELSRAAELDWESDLADDDEPPPEPPRPRGPDLGPAYLAAAALLIVLLALGLLTVGLHGRGHWARTILAVGSALLFLGLGLMALATWLVGGLERG